MEDMKCMEALADNLWENYMKQKVLGLLGNHISAFRAVVTARPGGGKLTVQRPFDYDKDGNPVSITLKCADSMQSAAVGTQVLVLVLGNLSNAFVFCSADLSNI